MFSKKEILVFVAGTLLATVLTVLGTFYVFKYYLLLHDPNDKTGRPQAVARDQAIVARRAPGHWAAIADRSGRRTRLTFAAL
jgi:hypothetical protein